jgi:hypothetical protein
VSDDDITPVDRPGRVRVLDFGPEMVPIKGKHRIIRGKVARRKPTDVDAIMLHQTACVFGPLSDPDKRYRRAMRVASHAVAFRDAVALTAPVDWYVNGGGLLNLRCAHLEIEGHFAGIADDPTTPQREDLKSTWGSTPTPLEGLALDCALLAFDRLLDALRTWGADPRYVLAHRQSTGTRRSDPGWEIWHKVALEHAVKHRGLQTFPNLKIGTGRPIPRQWERFPGARGY